MKYIRMFEDHGSFSVEEFFKNKINWKMIEDMKDMTLKYLDEEYIVIISVFHLSLRTEGYYMPLLYTDRSDSKPEWNEIQADKIEVDMDNYNREYGVLEYMINIIKRVGERSRVWLDTDEVNKLANRIGSRFSGNLKNDDDKCIRLQQRYEL